MQDGFRWKLSCGLLGTLSARGQSSKDPGIASVEVGFLEGEVVLAMVLNYEPKGQQHCFVLVCGTETVQFCALFSFLFFSFFLFFFFPTVQQGGQVILTCLFILLYGCTCGIWKFPG